MPKYYRGRENEVSDAPSLPVMHITSADSSLLNPNPDIVLVLQIWDWPIFESNIFDSSKYE